MRCVSLFELYFPSPHPFVIWESGHCDASLFYVSVFWFITIHLPPHRGTGLDLGKAAIAVRPLLSLLFGSPHPIQSGKAAIAVRPFQLFVRRLFIGYSSLLPVLQPVLQLDLGKWPCGAPPFQLHSISTPFPWFVKAAIAARPLFKPPSSGFYFGLSGPFSICPSKRQRPLRCALFLGSTRPHPVPPGSF